jgi:hypothetical protein
MRIRLVTKCGCMKNMEVPLMALSYGCIDIVIGDGEKRRFKYDHDTKNGRLVFKEVDKT